MQNDRRYFLKAAIGFGVAAIAGGSMLVPSHAAKVNAPGGVAISGYDPVAYFTENRAVEGSDAYTADHGGATYRFSTAANRDAFVADPDRYAPQYGGYCAYAVANGYTAKIDPEAYSVVDGKLYLNFSKSVRQRWSKDIPGHIASGDANWPKLSQ